MTHDEFKAVKLPLSRVSAELAGKCDIFICSASYEARCLSIPLQIPPSYVGFAVVLKNIDVLGAGNSNGERIVTHFGEKASIVEITKRAAVTTADNIASAILSRHQGDNVRIVIDITCMTHETLLILYSLLGHLLPLSRSGAVFLYNPAKEYDPGTPYEDKWLSRGTANIRSVLGFPGKLLPSRKNHLVVLVGFEVNRAASLIDVFEPTSLSLGCGDQASFREEHQIVNKQRLDQLVERYPQSSQFTFSPQDPRCVSDIILKEADQNSSKNVIVAPMNTKISTLGVALAATANSDIQLCYAAAASYNIDNYSEPDDYCVLFSL